VSELSLKVCAVVGVDPLRAIASGALLISVSPDHAETVERTFRTEGILCARIGEAEEGSPEVWDGETLLERPARDEIARLFETNA
jgi:hydrogenase maturation factor